MIVRFSHKDIPCTFNAMSNYVHVKEAGRERTIPIMSCAEDLRNAAVSAKVAVQRQRAREQFDPLSLQRI